MRRSVHNSGRSGSFRLVRYLLAKMIANITAPLRLIVRQAQLRAEGKLTDANAALARRSVRPNVASRLR
jgi:hypothetical protein